MNLALLNNADLGKWSGWMEGLGTDFSSSRT